MSLAVTRAPPAGAGPYRKGIPASARRRLSAGSRAGSGCGTTTALCVRPRRSSPSPPTLTRVAARAASPSEMRSLSARTARASVRKMEAGPRVATGVGSRTVKEK